MGLHKAVTVTTVSSSLLGSPSLERYAMHALPVRRLNSRMSGTCPLADVSDPWRSRFGWARGKGRQGCTVALGALVSSENADGGCLHVRSAFGPAALGIPSGRGHRARMEMQRAARSHDREWQEQPPCSAQKPGTGAGQEFALGKCCLSLQLLGLQASLTKARPSRDPG